MVREKALARKRLGLNAEMQPGRSEPPLKEAQETEVLLLALKISCCVKPGGIQRLGFVCLRYTSGAAVSAQRLAEWDLR